ncbi:alpha/beta family hydrolase [Arthrobacter nitrophenolicus]|jgi:predicted alpha/beta-hydrolase family hydrolase|uniref:Dienelactone hydrolase n=1 Tax=Arthrobacter nitrophenolicus TaxID=683150 RepID=A0A4R5Y7K3_9MICC|nr:alpha/beta family hydrolase [Arthrobacter nitrophenolicus]TDL39776.1 dienelactone hydrolase [Arthrobacter nitrophenolicus]
MPDAETQLSLDVDGTKVSAAYARPEEPWATVVVAHGAGAGMEHPFLRGFTQALNALGLATLRFNFPYREAGRRFPDRPPAAIATWRAAMVEAAGQIAAHGGSGPVWAAGKSFGGRMASMAVADGMPADGLIYLGYPLHPPGKLEKLRDEHLYGLTTPMLFLQGTRDTFATPEILEGVVSRIGPSAVLQWMEGGDHSFAVAGQKRQADEVGASLAAPVAEFIRASSNQAPGIR